MCLNCNYPGLLRDHGLKPTAQRLAVMNVLGRARQPLSAGEILEPAGESGPIDRVTVYRCLEALYRVGLAARLKAGGRGAWRYHLIIEPDHPAHPHFFCHSCGCLTCLDPQTVDLDMESIRRGFPARFSQLEIRLEGVCPDCLAGKSTPKEDS